MIVGVDAGALSISDERLKVGVYQITKYLLLNLCKRDRTFSYKLYSFLPIEKKLLEKFGDNVVNIVLVPKFGWYSIRLPLELKLHPPDVFLGLSQALPRFSPTHSIGFIYDLAFLHYPRAYPDSLTKLKSRTKLLIRRSNHIVTISNSSKKDIIEHYEVDRNKVTVAYPGIDGSFSPNGPKIIRGNPYFLYVGSLKKIKNIPLILKAFRIFLDNQNNTYDLVILGSNFWIDTEISSVISSLRLTENVFVKGFVSDNILRKYYRGAVCLLTPSLFEGFCFPAAEAMASGCPVIVSNRGALPEVVGSAGIYVDPGDPYDIAKGLAKVVDNSNTLKKLVKSGLKQCQMYSWEKFAENIYKIIS